MIDDNIEQSIKDKICVQLANTYYELGEERKVREYLRYLKKYNYKEYKKATKTTRMNMYFSKDIIEFLKQIKKGL